MSENFFDYSKSPTPPTKSGARKETPFIKYERTEKPGANTPQRAFVDYNKTPRPGLNAETVWLPLRPGRTRAEGNFTETEVAVKLHDVGRHVVQQVSDALKVSDSEARTTLHWYTGALKGAGVLDKTASDKLEKFAERFQTIANPRDLLDQQIGPFLEGLQPTARESEPT